MTKPEDTSVQKQQRMSFLMETEEEKERKKQKEEGKKGVKWNLRGKKEQILKVEMI